MNEQMNVPNIRFPHYFDAWEVILLSDLVTSVDFGWSPQCDDGVSTKDEWGVLKTSSIQWTGFEPDKNKKLPKKLEPKKKLSLKKDDILITRVGPNKRVGVVSRVNQDYPKLMLSDKIIRLRTKPEIDSSYVALILSLKKSNYQIVRKASKLATSQTSIPKKHLLQTKLTIPTLPEQQNIISFLSKVDEKIALLTEKKNKLIEYKKCLIQQLLDCKWKVSGNEKTFLPSTLRFKANDGSEFPDWKEKKVGELIHFFNGKVHEKYIDPNGQYIVVNSKFVLTQSKVKKFCHELISPLNKNDIAMVMSDIPNGKALAKCYLIPRNNKYTLNQRICALRSNSSILNEFIIHQLNRNKYYLKFDSGVGQTNLTKNEVLSCPLLIPNIEEQRKIASFLASIDKKISLARSELNRTKDWKKGLLQQMLI